MLGARGQAWHPLNPSWVPSSGVPTPQSAVRWGPRGDSTGAVLQFLDKLSMPVVGAWCSWPDSAENCGSATVAVQIVASRATDHGEIVEVIQNLRRGVDCGVSCHRSWENRESDPAFAMRSRSWRLVPLIMGKLWK